MPGDAVPLASNTVVVCGSGYGEISYSGLLQFLPLVAADARLPQDAGKKFTSDIALMGVRQCDGDTALNHVLVLTARIRTIESRLTQVAN
jgi:hypothetical protein